MSAGENGSQQGADGFVGLLTSLFIALKLTDVIAWSWWWVLSPIWIGAAIALVGLAVIFLIDNLTSSRQPLPSKENDMSDLTPMPIELLVEHAIKDGYDDGVGGSCGGVFDVETGVLTLTYERDEEMPELDEEGEDDEDYNHSTTVRRFQLIPEEAAAETTPTTTEPTADDPR